MSKKNDDIKLKLTIIGDWNVGKTSLLYRFTDDVFYEVTKLSMGEQYNNKSIFIGGKSIGLQIKDTSGMEKFRSLNNSFYSFLDGILIVYDISNQETFENAKLWVNEAKKLAPKDCVLIIVGSKLDLENKVVDSNIVKSYTDSLNIKFFETSSKNSINVEETFITLIEDILFKKNLFQSVDNCKKENQGEELEKKKKVCSIN
ncbi:hypothetical protein ACTFIV_002331 [Dictyostelium citrinum]